MDPFEEVSFRLLAAARNGDLDKIRRLVENNPGIDLREKKSRVLHHAVWKGHQSVVEYLIGAGANLEHMDDEGRTPLHYATWYGQLSVTILLVNAGANINSLDIDKWTPIHSAAWRGHKTIVKFLLEAGAIYTSLTCGRDDRGPRRTPKKVAQDGGHDSIVKLLQFYEDNPILDIKEPACD